MLCWSTGVELCGRGVVSATHACAPPAFPHACCCSVWRTLQAAVAEACATSAVSVPSPVTVSQLYVDALSTADLLGWNEARQGRQDTCAFVDGAVTAVVRRSTGRVAAGGFAGLPGDATGASAGAGGGASEGHGAPDVAVADDSFMHWLVLDGGGAEAAGSGVDGAGAVGARAVEEALLGVLDVAPASALPAPVQAAQAGPRSGDVGTTGPRGKVLSSFAGSVVLPNGERVMSGQCLRVLFETADLTHASPATISRCGVLSIDPLVG